MNTIGVMATYPQRKLVATEAIGSIEHQLDRLVVVLNNYDSVPPEYPDKSHIEYIIPDADLKDVGKFLISMAADSFVFTLDDDIQYPEDYAATMLLHYERIPVPRKAIGVHGVTYSDFFDGQASSRLVYLFSLEVKKYHVVNQLGTGTMMTVGKNIPPFLYMEGSQKFVDVRYGKFARENGIACCCVPRPRDWLKQLPVAESIFEDFTKNANDDFMDDVLEIGGLSRLDVNAVSKVQSLNCSERKSESPTCQQVLEAPIRKEQMLEPPIRKLNRKYFEKTYWVSRVARLRNSIRKLPNKLTR